MTVGPQQLPNRRYRRIRQLGQGGMGVVFEVFDAVLERRIALKTLRSEDPELLYRLKREFRSLADLRHPNLTELYDLSIDDGRCSYTMELIDGLDFVQTCRVGEIGTSAQPAFDEARLRDGLAQLVAGLGALHAAGKIHRDVKPSNVLVARSGRVVLLDFGLVADLSDPRAATLTAHLVGTAAYMAPEQAEVGASVGEAADWYGVGVILYEVLSGSCPFQGSMLQLLRDKLASPAPDVRSRAPDAPADLAELCMALLRRDARARPGGAEILATLSKLTVAHGAARRPRDARPAFAGRSAELAALHAEFTSVAAGACRVVMIRGPSGIGKSSLVREFLDQVYAGGADRVLLEGRCYARESIPYRALDGIVDQLSEYWRHLPYAQAMYLLPREPETLTMAFPVLERVKAVADESLQRPELDPQDACNRAAFALRETLQRLCRRRRLVIFLDDMQWVDADSMRLLRFLTESNEAPALLLLVAARPLDPLDPRAELLEPLVERALELELRRLSLDETEQLIRGISAAFPEQTVHELAREAGGSPFFAEALARGAEQGGLGSAELDLNALLAQAIAAQSELGRRLLTLAAVAEQPISVERAARALGEPLASVAREARGLHARRLTRGVHEALETSDRLELYHDRIREALVGSLGAAERQRVHGQLASAFESEPEPDLEACCRHFLGAEERTKAATYARRAAEAAERELAFDRAARYYDLCVQLEGPQTAASSSLTERLAGALSNAGRGVEAAERYLIAAQSAHADVSLRCRYRAAEEFLRTGHPERGMLTLEVVLREVGLRRPRRGAAALLQVLLLRLKNRLLARAPARLLPAGAGAAATRPGSSSLLQKVDVCAAVAFSLGYIAPVQTQYFQALHLGFARRLGEASRLCRALSVEAIYASVGGGKYARVEQLLAQARGLAERVTDPRARGSFAMAEGLTAFFRGDWIAARRKCVAAEELLRSELTGVQFELDTAMLYHLSSLHFMGNLTRLRTEVERRLREAEARHDLYALTILRARMQAVLYLADDEPEAVKPAVESVMWGWRADELSIPRYWQLFSEIQTALYQGDAAAAQAAIAARGRHMARSLLLRVQVTRVRLWQTRALAALGAAQAGIKRQENLQRARRDAALLTAERVPWARAMATSLRAAEAALAGSTSASSSLFQASEDAFVDAGMSLDAAAARRRRGELVGGAQGAQLVAEADLMMSRQAIRNPEAFCRLLAPVVSETARETRLPALPA